MTQQRPKRDVQAYLAAQDALPTDKQREGQRYQATAWRYVQQMVITFGIIILGIIVLLWLLGTVITAPCISNFYDEMPIYPNAELIENKASFWNWLGLGQLSVSYQIDAPFADVDAWYSEQLANQAAALETARLQGDSIPIWEGRYTLRVTNNDVIIEKESVCFTKLRQ